MKKTFKHFICLFVAILCFGQMWATDYTLAASTFNGDKNSATVNGQTFTLNPAHGGTGQTGYGDYIKFSKSKTYTITLPDGFVLTNVNVKGYTNASATNGEITEVNGTSQSSKTFPAKDDASLATATQITTGYNFAISQTGGTVTIKTANTNQICVLITISGTPAGGGDEPGDEPDPDAPTTGTIDDLVTIDDAFTFEPTATLANNTLYEGKKIISLGESPYKNNGVQIKSSRQLAFKVAAGAKIVVTFNENDTRAMQIGTSSAGTELASSATSPVTANRTTAGIVYISASSDLYLTKLEISYPTFYTITYNYNGGTLKEGESDITESAKETGETFTVASASVLDAPDGKEFDKWNDGSADYAQGATYTVGTANVTLTAQWRNETTKYAVTYDLGDYTAGVAPTETDKSEGSVFAIKAAPEWTDHDFLGWKCNIDNNTYQATNNYTMTAAATTFTAQWQEYFTITYKDGEETLGTEKVNAGDSPAGIADPVKELYSFVGWTLEGEDDLIDPTTLDASTTLFAKWVDFDGCAYLASETSGSEPSVGDAVILKSSSFGGAVKVVGKNKSGSITYTEYGLSFTGGGNDSIRVTLNNQMQVGTKISVCLVANGKDARGLKLLTLSGTEKTTLGFGSGTKSGDVGTFTYTVTASDGLDGMKAFRLSRSNSVYLKYITIEECAPQDFTVTYTDGASTMGTEYVIENEHPTASGITTRKNGYVFDGWAETDGGSVVDLDDITITADKTLYAVYSERVCATSGSMFKFQMKTDLTSGNVFSSAPNSIAATTDNYLATLAGGEVTFAVTGTNNNRLQFYDGKAVGFGDGGSITIHLDCPLAENDEIRFINYASSGNSITLSAGANSTTLDGNKSETVQTWSVPAAWAGAYELTMVRNAGTAKLTYFEIYRRPVLTSVSLEDLNLKVGATGTPVMTLNPEGALVTSQAWAITASTATGTTINAETGLITAGETAGQLTVQVTLNSNKVATCTVKVVPGYESVQPVSETTTWQWEGVLAANANIAEGDTVLANYYAGEQWEKIAGKKGEYAYRAENYDCYQGTYLYFKATVPGILTIYARYASACTMSINGNEVADLTNSYQTYYAAVPAGNVFITSTAGMRIKSMKFDTDMQNYAITDNAWGGYDRTVNAGNYGTICLPKAGVMTGASIYEIAYFDNTQSKIFFDEIINGQMVAGRPYIFLPNEGETELKVYYTDNANAIAGDYRGLYGFFDTSDDNAIKKLAENDYFLYNNQYYVVDHAAVGLVAVGNYRAYIKLSDIDGYPSEPAPGRRRVAMSVNGEQVATGVENVTDANAPRKVLIDGRMFIMLGEKMYDVTGQIAK